MRGLRGEWCLCVCLLACGHSSDRAGGGGAGAGATGGGSTSSTGGGDVGVTGQAVVSSDGYASAATGCGSSFVDHDCDAVLDALDCTPPQTHIDFDPAVICPLCVDGSATDPSDCPGWQARYGDFLTHVVNASCSNWCEQDSDCFAWEINNSCGTWAWSLYGMIDEEPLGFAQMFADQNCNTCGTVASALYLRASGTTEVTPVDGAPPGGDSGLLQQYRPACRGHQCVLLPD